MLVLGASPAQVSCSFKYNPPSPSVARNFLQKQGIGYPKPLSAVPDFLSTLHVKSYKCFQETVMHQLSKQWEGVKSVELAGFSVLAAKEEASWESCSVRD